MFRAINSIMVGFEGGRDACSFNVFDQFFLSQLFVLHPGIIIVRAPMRHSFFIKIKVIVSMLPQLLHIQNV